MRTFFSGGRWAFLGVLFAITACSTKAQTRQFTISYGAEVSAVPSGTQALDLWLPVPQDSPNQEITDLVVTSPFPHDLTVEPIFHNRILHVRIANPPREFAVSYSIKATRREATGPERDGVIDKMTALRPTKLVPVGGQSREIAKRVVGNAVGGDVQSKALYDYVLEHMAYDKNHEGWGHGDFNHACVVGKGNCTDFHAYFISLSRSLDIPAFFEMGFSLPQERGEAWLGGYHCWAWYEGDGGWSPVDISEADKNAALADYFYGHLCENRLAMSRGRDIILSPPQQGEPLNYFIFPYCEIDGQTFTSVKRVVMYKDLD